MTPPGLNEVLQRTFSFPKKHFLSATDLNEVEVANLLDLADGIHDLLRQRRTVRRHHAERMNDRLRDGLPI
jgi:ornithine carbamoyltransferase